MIRIRIIDPRSLGSWCVKGTSESFSRVNPYVPLMHHDPSDLGSLILIRNIPKERTLRVYAINVTFMDRFCLLLEVNYNVYLLGHLEVLEDRRVALQEQLVATRGGERLYAENLDINFQSTKLPLKMKDLTFLEDILCPGKSSSDPLMLHPLKVSMDYCLHPVSAEPALFPRSKLSSSRKSASEPILQRPEAIGDKVSTLVELLLMVRDTEEGKQHILSQIEAMEVLKMLLKDGTFQIPVMETLKDREKNSKSGVYNGFLLIWDVLDREDFKAFMRKSKFDIVVQPDGKEDDCIVFPKTFPVLRFLNCCLFGKGAAEDDGIEMMEMDVQWNPDLTILGITIFPT
ncbi:hypothetical protein ACROYT_G031557 [Oculina patagonica]